jgi:hypothetical protein
MNLRVLELIFRREVGESCVESSKRVGKVKDHLVTIGRSDV